MCAMCVVYLYVAIDCVRVCEIIRRMLGVYMRYVYARVRIVTKCVVVIMLCVVM